MPNCGSQLILCDLPIRFDTYRGCTHGCDYCFANRKRVGEDREIVIPYETALDLRNFVEGKRSQTTNWCDWKIPLHWGGMSDPFQPCELEHRRSWECLQIFAESQYPCVFSTKGALAGTDEYLEMFAKCNFVGQVSLLASSYDVRERGAPTCAQRIEIVGKLVKVCKRVLARMQPLMLSAVDEICRETIPALAAVNCFGVTVEGYKAMNRDMAEPGMEKLGADLVYPDNEMKDGLLTIRAAARAAGLAFYAAENRYRPLGDDLNCCGTSGVPGFVHNRCNLNHLYYGGYATTEAQESPNTGTAIASLFQSGAGNTMCGPLPMHRLVEGLAKARPLRIALGVETESQMGLFGGEEQPPPADPAEPE